MIPNYFGVIFQIDPLPSTDVFDGSAGSLRRSYAPTDWKRDDVGAVMVVRGHLVKFRIPRPVQLNLSGDCGFLQPQTLIGYPMRGGLEGYRKARRSKKRLESFGTSLHTFYRAFSFRARFINRVASKSYVRCISFRHLFYDGAFFRQRIEYNKKGCVGFRCLRLGGNDAAA